MTKVELHIIALAESESSKGNYVLILEEQGGNRRRLPIVIGPFEAQAIAIFLQGLQVPRPQTHDLFKNTLDAAGVQLTEVFISKLEEGVFHATLIGKKQDGSPLQEDARSSDAAALAIRFGCPIYTTTAIMKSAGIIRNGPKVSEKLESLSVGELEQMLEQAVTKEDYELAVKIREVLKKKG